VTQTGSSGATRVTRYDYDPDGNTTLQSVYSDTSGHPAAWWPLSQTAGSTVTDWSGTGNTANASGVTWTGGAASFAGTSGQGIVTNGPAVNTGSSFTVSAWVNLPSAPSQDAAIVSQAGSNVDAFALIYNPGVSKWELDLAGSDTSALAPIAVDGNQPSGTSLTGTWTHLTGVYDASAQTATLYVDGVEAGTASNVGVFNAGGPLRIGESSNGDYLKGSVGNVQVYPRALSASEVASLYSAGRSGGTTGSSASATTTWALDERGLPTSMTDPDGNITRYTYDEAGRPAMTTDPAVATETYVPGTGDETVTASPVWFTGYDNFGDIANTSDPKGDVVTYTYDGDGRQTGKILPSYTPPGSSPISNATYTTNYNPDGIVLSTIDPEGKTTKYGHDQLGDITSVADPDGNTTSHSYDTDGNQLSVTTPDGAQTQATWDYLGRQLTSTQVERYSQGTANPVTADDTAQYNYATSATDPGGSWASSVVSPDGATTGYEYDAAGEVTSQTTGAASEGSTTSYGYNYLGLRTQVTYPDQGYEVTGYDATGDPVSAADHSSSGNVLRSASATYDGDGNLTSSTDFNGHTATFSYDPAGQLTSEIQPVSATSSITTSFGYDAAGNLTRYTDGDGSNSYYTWNTWGLPESKIEPPTAANYSAADSTWTTAYDENGRPATITEPGGVTVTDSYDNENQLTGQSATGADAPTAARTYTYNPDGTLSTAATSNTAATGSNATSESFTYNDRGEVLSASGSAGSTSYSYNGDGLPASITDAAGTTSYSYDDQDRLKTLTDPATGTTASYTYNADSQPTNISYGNGDSQVLQYTPLRQLQSNTLQTSAGTAIASVSYGYNPDGQVESLDTTGLAGSSANSYTHDWAGRLTSWNNGTTTTSYGYNNDGDLTSAGSKTYTYDSRDELTSDGTNTYTYTARGTVASQTTPTGTINTTFDAYGDQSTAGSQTYNYDALGRLLSDTGGSGTGYTFSYRGPTSTLVSDGTSTYTWDPAGTNLIGIGVAGGTAAQGVLAFTNQHGDVLGQFKPSGTALTGSTGYDPWGNITGTTGTLSGQLGYQSAWTDPVTNKVAMGARWYSPGTGDFTSADTASVSPIPDSADANPFAYGGDDPIDQIDPSGHIVIPAGGAYGNCTGSCAQAVQQYDTQLQNEYSQPAQSSCGNWFSCGYHWVVSHGSHIVHRIVHYAAVVYHVVVQTGTDLLVRSVRNVSLLIADAARFGAHAASATFHVAISAGSRVYHSVTTYAAQSYQQVVHAVQTAYHAVARVATATVNYTRHHIAAIAAVAASAVVMVGCEATLGTATAGTATPVCGALAGAAGSVVSYGINAIQTGHFSFVGLGEAALTGAVIGGAMAGLGEFAGSAASVLSAGADDAAVALADTAATDAAGALAEGASASGDGAASGAGADATNAADDAGASGARGDPSGGSDSGTGTSTSDAAASSSDPSAVGGQEEPAGGTGDQQAARGESPRAEDACGGQSFTASTRVLLASGKARAISALKPGQEVLATSTRTGKNHAETVAAVLVHHDTDLYDLRVRAGTVPPSSTPPPATCSGFPAPAATAVAGSRLPRSATGRTYAPPAATTTRSSSAAGSRASTTAGCGISPSPPATTSTSTLGQARPSSTTARLLFHAVVECTVSEIPRQARLYALGGHRAWPNGHSRTREPLSSASLDSRWSTGPMTFTRK
jgi:RHS repeat-associated protein